MYTHAGTSTPKKELHRSPSSNPFEGAHHEVPSASVVCSDVSCANTVMSVVAVVPTGEAGGAVPDAHAPVVYPSDGKYASKSYE